MQIFNFWNWSVKNLITVGNIAANSSYVICKQKGIFQYE